MRRDGKPGPQPRARQREGGGGDDRDVDIERPIIRLVGRDQERRDEGADARPGRRAPGRGAERPPSVSERDDAEQNEGRAGRQEFVERISGIDRRISHDGPGGGQDARNIRGRQAGNACKPFSSARPFADRDQGDGEQRAERDADARTDQPLLDRVAHQKDAAERKRDAADPNDPAGAEPLFKADRARRWRRGGADGRRDGGGDGGSGGGAAGDAAAASR